ncbi:HK97 family phage prohead protease [Bacteroides sp. CR5/BHMF/2]|nr:HK97 family phage prohead protease [Bacteroides sp. CR5/BHMF/2]
MQELCQLELDDYGLKYRFEAPSTPDGDFAVEMIKRGDIFGSSFCVCFK